MKVITTHFNADFDCLASMLAAKKLYPDARIVFPGAQEKNVRDFLKASDYSFQFDKLKNISLDEITTLIIVDTRLAGRIGLFESVVKRKGVSVHVYDHHPNTPQDIESEVTVVKERGSTTTLFVELLREKGIPLTPAEATIMALGIYEDTGSLTFTSTRPEDLEASAYLLSIGANLNVVSDFIYRELSPEQFSLLNDLIHGLEIHDINGLPVAVATASSDHYIGDLAILTHKLKDMENLNCLFVLVRMEDRIHLVARSRIEAVDVAAVAHEFGGGGHPTASSATIRDMTMIQIEERLINVLKEKVHPVKLAKEMMTYPVKSVQRDEAIKSTEELMTRYNLNTLPVLDGKKPVGLITRQIVEKAIFHHLKEEKVSDLMISEFSTVHSDTPYRRIDEIIIVGKQRLVPVVNDSGEMEGIISRGDLLRAIYGDMLKKPAVLYSKEGGTRYPFSKNLKGLLSERLPERILKLLYEAGDVADEMGFSAFLVGGFVRDLLLRLVPESFNQGIENLDIDMVIEGDGILFAEKFAERLSGRVKSHKKFGTAVVIIPSLPPLEKGGKGEFKIDIATARMEYYEHPAALPIVEMSSLKNDLYRRDFTINTLAISLNKKGAWNLIDFFGGQRDLKERAIRVLHNLSFVEDPTRVFRAIRFEQRFNFSIGKQTMTILEGAVKKDLFNRLSGSRVYLELVLMLKEREPVKIVKRMQELSLLKFIHPKIIYSDSMKELFLNIGETISWHHLLFIGSEAEGWFIYLMGLLDDLKDEDVLDVCRRLSISEHYKNKLLTGRSQIKEAYQELFSSGTNTFKSSLIYDVLHPLPLEALLFMMAKVPQERIKKAISLYLTKLRTVKIDITGDDIVEMGIERGPEVGSILKAVRDAKLDG
ncbi:MAG: CBS domain-containing protein, partial [Nitrospinae bacterium]|nr:CBS domain-containing protein [Nitrospinota bacterium]